MATIIEPSRTYTPEEFLSIDEGGTFELIDGHLAETHVSYLSELAGSRLLSRLDQYCERERARLRLRIGNHAPLFPEPARPNPKIGCLLRQARSA